MCGWPFKNSCTASNDVDSSRAVDSWRQWIFTPKCIASSAMRRWSVDTHTSLNSFEFFMMRKVRPSNDTPLTLARFFNGMPLEPPRASTNAVSLAPRLPLGINDSRGQLPIEWMDWINTLCNYVYLEWTHALVRRFSGGSHDRTSEIDAHNTMPCNSIFPQQFQLILFTVHNNPKRSSGREQQSKLKNEIAV